MKMRTLVDIRRLAGRTARIGTVRSKAVRRRRTVPSLSSAAKSHAGAWAIPRCSRTPIRICSISLVRNTPVGITRFASCPEPKLHVYGAPLDKNDRSKAVEIVRRFRCTVACEVLRSGDENGHRLRESSRNPEWSLEDHLSG